MIAAALEKSAIFYYILPTYSQCRKVIFDGKISDEHGTRFIDYIPKSLVSSINSTDMKITLVNGSLIQLCGSYDYDRLMGTNPSGCVFSEYSLSDPMALNYIRPILMANKGWLIVISTPRGHNALWDLYNIASTSEDWFCSKLTVEDTQHISLDEIQREINSGEISEELAKQEYWSSFSQGILGSIYCKQVDKMRVDGRIGQVPYEPQYPVYVFTDIGLDCTSLVFAQVINSVIHIIYYYENTNLSLDHYISIIKNQPYSNIEKVIFPHDVQNREYTSGISRLDIIRNNNLRYMVAPNISIEDGIEATKIMLARCWIDQDNCQRLIKCLENYRQVYDDKKQQYTGKICHDQFSHCCDALRMGAVSISKLKIGTSAADLDKRFLEACAGPHAQLPKFFRTDGELPPY